MASLPILTHEYILLNPSNEKINNNVSISEYLFKEMEKYGNTPALVHSLFDQKISYQQIMKDSFAIAAALKSKGIKSGDVVGICSENNLEYASVILGILIIGATCAPINPLYTISELKHTLSISRPVIIFCSHFSIHNIEETTLELPFVKELILFNNNSDAESKFTTYESLINLHKNSKPLTVENINPTESVAFLLCSSGTTGLPKCVELTHANYMNLLNFVRLLWTNDDSGPNKVTLGLIPFFHGYGCCILLISLMLKVYLVVMPRFDEMNFLEAIQNYKVTNLYVVPPILVFLSKHPLVQKYNLSSIRKLTCGAAPLSKETQENAQKRLNLNFEIQQGYGMTELSVCCVAFQNNINKIGSSGTIAPGMMLKIVDIETGKALPPYNQGELCFKGPFVMKGYRNNPIETEKVFDSQGWFHTGDIGYIDNEGFIYIVSRLKELIKYKGFQVSPTELETVLLSHPGVKEAGVIGIPDEEAGELPLAFIVKQPGANITEDEIKKYVAGKVSPQKKLHGGVRFIPEIPKNPSGKILRRELQAMNLRLWEMLYCNV
ncbi:luciferase, putative [Pediculus humanus corporis]|uniref:Luciferin 4-monooxygenase n=1 Tax=Pediculus humanus subsp. corporis TaxID=121224 RepID=E0VSL5_PEDHC|nr:luciferase, putative [Pediculus humanus corporis]EEB16371.1 luciferase, putative [Pediculus humanus corporis]